jgi:hypothetical protein
MGNQEKRREDEFTLSGFSRGKEVSTESIGKSKGEMRTKITCRLGKKSRL